MKQIRRSLFETNSSSVHTLSISKVGLEPSKLKLNKDGNIEVEFAEFGKDENIYDTQYEKLQYLLSFIAYYSGLYYGDASDLEELYERYDFREVRDAICEYAGANDIVIVGNKEAYIDHQSMYDCAVSLYDEDEIVNFVFNKYAALKTSCD